MEEYIVYKKIINIIEGILLVLLIDYFFTY